MNISKMYPLTPAKIICVTNNHNPQNQVCIVPYVSAGWLGSSGLLYRYWLGLFTQQGVASGWLIEAGLGWHNSAVSNSSSPSQRTSKQAWACTSHDAG